jgi:hypothetical protein
MLTIKHYYKLCAKPVGMGWEVSFCDETNEHYEIKLVQSSSHLSTTVYLQRTPATVRNGENIYLFKRGDGATLTSIGISASWIKDMSNLLKILDNFTL